MQAVVVTPHTKKANGPDFRVEGKFIPMWFIELMKNAFTNVKVENDTHSDYVNIFETGWYKKLHAKEKPGEALKILRIAAGLTQDQLAKKSGILKQNICAMEKGTRKITLKSAQKLATALGTSPTIILCK